MADIKFHPEARADLADIYAHGLDDFGPERAQHYLDELQSAISRLQNYAELGPVYPGIRPASRYLPFRRHHVFYDYNGMTVSITRILHHAIDARRAL